MACAGRAAVHGQAQNLAVLASSQGNEHCRLCILCACSPQSSLCEWVKSAIPAHMKRGNETLRGIVPKNTATIRNRIELQYPMDWCLRCVPSVHDS